MQTLRLRPLTEPEIETALRATPTDYAEADALYAAHLSEGNYRKALDLYEGHAAELGEEYALLQRILRATVNAQPREMKLLAEDLAALSKEEQASLLEYLARMFREFYLYNLSLPDINYLTSREEGIARYLRSCITGRNVRQVEAEIDEAARHLAQNVQARWSSSTSFCDSLRPSLRATSRREYADPWCSQRSIWLICRIFALHLHPHLPLDLATLRS